MFVADQGELDQLLAMLHKIQLGDNEVQRQIYLQQQQLEQKQDYYSYLTHILTSPTLGLTERQLAGLVLKSSLYRNKEVVEASRLQNIMATLEKALHQDIPPKVEQTIVLNICQLISLYGLRTFESTLLGLLEQLEYQNVAAIQKSMLCLKQTLEDLKENTENMEYVSTLDGDALMKRLVKSLLRLVHPQVQQIEIRRSAVHMMNIMTGLMMSAMSEQMTNVLQALLCNEQDPKMRMYQYMGLVSVWENRQEDLYSVLDQVVAKMVVGTAESGLEIRREAAYFWPEFLRREAGHEGREAVGKDVLRDHLDNLLASLVTGLHYTQQDLINLQITNCSLNEEQLDEDTEQQKEEEEEETPVEQMTLRRVCALSLEKLSEVYPQQLFPRMQTTIEKGIQSDQWKNKESVVLLMGLLANHQDQSMSAQLVNILQCLLSLDGHSLVVATSTWSFSKLLPNLPAHPLRDELCTAWLRRLMQHIMSDDSQIQQSAHSAFSAFLNDSTGTPIHPYVPDILQVLALALSRYKDSQLAGLYSSIASLFDTASVDVSAGAQLLQVLINHKFLMSQLESSTAQSRDALNSLLECLVSVGSSVGLSFGQQYGQAILEKVIQLQNVYLTNQDSKVDYEYRQTFLRTIDILSLLLEQLGAAFHSLPAATRFYELVPPALAHSSLETRQFVLSLIGEMAQLIPQVPALVPIYSQLMPSIYPCLYYPGSHLDPGSTYLTLCNNALYCLGEIAMAYPQLLHPQLAATQQQVISHFTTHKKLQRLFAQNVAKTLGRLALVHKNGVVPHLGSIMKQWSLSIRGCSDSLSKRQSVQGILAALLDNQPVAHEYFEYVLYVFTGIETQNNEFGGIQETVRLLAMDYKQQKGEQAMQEAMGSLDQASQNKLRMLL